MPRSPARPSCTFRRSHRRGQKQKQCRALAAPCFVRFLRCSKLRTVKFAWHKSTGTAGGSSAKDCRNNCWKLVPA
eukprot:10991665-Alexandrium_andersonii.AAC.1